MTYGMTDGPLLTQPLTLRGVTLPNRSVVSPMSQYLSRDGYANDYHLVHLGRFALGGAGLVFTEATAVEARGRRTPGDLGLWEDGQSAEMARIAAFIADQGSLPGIQLAHAGRKASERRPWDGETPLDAEDEALRGEAPWTAVAPSAEPFGPDWHVPEALDQAGIDAVVANFAAATRRAAEAGYKVLEIYAGHGFLVHQFLSPLANRRQDGYGGSRANRMRFACEVAAAVRGAWPADLPLSFRISAVDWHDGGWELEDTLALAPALQACGVDILDCSSGGISGHPGRQRIAIAPAFQAPFAEAVKAATGMTTMTVGFLRTPAEAEAVLQKGQADLVALARELLYDPNWARHAAEALGADPDFGSWPPQFGWWLQRRAKALARLAKAAVR
ncbi:MAG: NADH:flavin oxidoreductase/NADH oxidase [Rhodospirillales bacterium]